MVVERASLLAVTLLVGLALPAVATAQTLSIETGARGVTRRDPRDDISFTYINHADCMADETMTFNVMVQGSVGDEFYLEAWVGSGCETAANRVGTAATCRRLASQRWKMGGGLPVSVRALIAGVNETTGANAGADTDAGATDAGADDAGTTDAGTVDAGNPATAAICEGSGRPTKFTISFLLIDGANAEPQGYMPTTWEGQFDLKGPDAPSGVSAGIGEETLVVAWTPPSGSVATEIGGYDVFCDPPPGATVDAGAPSDAGASCTASSDLIAGEAPPAANICGHATGPSSNVETVPLTNGVSYTVGVAAMDTFKNYSPLSSTACNRPEPVTGFFEAYRAAGGQGGGGFCAIHAGRSRALLALAGLTLAAYAARRRLRGRTRRGSTGR